MKNVPKSAGSAEFTEKKSRFIGFIAPVQTETEARDVLATVRKQHSTARHNVYCWRLGDVSRHSDDGEPSGTAGMPLLDVFLRREVTNFCCVATRYFGGILLGAGGLVRAYARTAVVALDAVGVEPLRHWVAGEITCGYDRYDAVRRLCDAHEVRCEPPVFAADVAVALAIPEDQLDAFKTALDAFGNLLLTVTDGRQ